MSNTVVPDSTAEIYARQRRQLLLKGLGKGSVAAAAMIPLSSQATRSYVLANPDLGAGNGYCSVSGFQSAAISVAPGQTLKTCSAAPPSDYFANTPGSYTWTSRNNAGTNAGNRRAAIRALFVSTFGFSESDALLIPNDTLDTFITVATPATGVIISGAIYWATAHNDSGVNNATATGTIRQLKASTNYPGPVGSTWLPLRSFENMMDNTGSADVTVITATVLYTLFNVQSDNKAYFAAVALGCIKEDNGSFQSSAGFSAGSIPFDAKYVGDLYNDTNKRVAAGAFFKKLCGA